LAAGDNENPKRRVLAELVEMTGFSSALTGHASFEGHCRSGVENDLGDGSTLRSWPRGGSKNAFSFVFELGSEIQTISTE